MSRIDSLIAKMTLAEKLGQLTMTASSYAVTGPVIAGDSTQAIKEGTIGNLLNMVGADHVREVQRLAVEESRLGIPLLIGFDIIHGHRTIFPIPLAEAGLFDPPKALQRLLERGATVVIITLGERGLIWATRETSGSLPARKVKVVDTTGAGDAFCGALAARLADGVPLPEALQFANAAGALAVTRQGAQPSLPTLAEIETMLARV